MSKRALLPRTTKKLTFKLSYKIENLEWSCRAYRKLLFKSGKSQQKYFFSYFYIFLKITHIYLFIYFLHFSLCTFLIWFEYSFRLQYIILLAFIIQDQRKLNGKLLIRLSLNSFSEFHRNGVCMYLEIKNFVERIYLLIQIKTNKIINLLINYIACQKMNRNFFQKTSKLILLEFIMLIHLVFSDFLKQFRILRYFLSKLRKKPFWLIFEAP